jgi:hypothetical protein
MELGLSVRPIAGLKFPTRLLSRKILVRDFLRKTSCRIMCVLILFVKKVVKRFFIFFL